jgi:hypothetical protein
MPRSTALAPLTVERKILLLRGERVMLDSDLAALYGVPTKALVQAVKRNATRFPPDFMFQLSAEEDAALRSQIVTSKPGRGGRRSMAHVVEPHGGVFPLSPRYQCLALDDRRRVWSRLELGIRAVPERDRDGRPGLQGCESAVGVACPEPGRRLRVKGARRCGPRRRPRAVDCSARSACPDP